MKKFCCLFFLLLLVVTTEAQRFNAGAVLGLNASQLNGDLSAGFNKLGIHGGLRATIFFTEKFDLALEMLYSQQGSQPKLIQGEVPSSVFWHIRVNYISVPVMACYKDWYNEAENYYKMKFSAGLAYGYLINANIWARAYKEEYFNKNDVSFLAGATFNLNENWGLGVRYTRSINYLFNPEKQPLNELPLLGYFLSFRVEYML